MLKIKKNRIIIDNDVYYKRYSAFVVYVQRVCLIFDTCVDIRYGE